MLTGIALKTGSTFVFSLMSAGVKFLTGAYPIAQIVFSRSFFALIVLILWLAWRGEFPRAIYTTRIWGHIGRCMFGSVGMFLGFISLAYLPLPDATALGYVAPLMTVVLAALILGETVRVYRWSAVALGFAGVIVMLHDHLGEGDGDGAVFGVLAALGGAFCSAGATIQTRRLTQTEQTGAIVFYFSLITTLAGLIAMLAGYVVPASLPGGEVLARQVPVMPASAADAAFFVLVGVFGGMGQILMTASFRHADASIIACFDYTSMIWAVLLSLALFGQAPSASILIGAGVIAASGLFVIWREQRLGLIKREVRQAGPQRPI